MNTQTKGLLLIFFGALLVLLAGGEFIIRAFIVLFGLYLVFIGLQLRNAHRILFFINRFTNRFSDRF